MHSHIRWLPLAAARCWSLLLAVADWNQSSIDHCVLVMMQGHRLHKHCCYTQALQHANTHGSYAGRSGTRRTHRETVHHCLLSCDLRRRNGSRGEQGLGDEQWILWLRSTLFIHIWFHQAATRFVAYSIWPLWSIPKIQAFPGGDVSVNGLVEVSKNFILIVMSVSSEHTLISELVEMFPGRDLIIIRMKAWTKE